MDFVEIWGGSVFSSESSMVSAEARDLQGHHQEEDSEREHSVPRQSRTSLSGVHQKRIQICGSRRWSLGSGTMSTIVVGTHRDSSWWNTGLWDRKVDPSPSLSSGRAQRITTTHHQEHKKINSQGLTSGTRGRWTPTSGHFLLFFYLSRGRR